MSDISRIDSNFAVSAAPGSVYLSIDEPPFCVYGVNKDEIGYYRLPQSLEAVNPGFPSLRRHTAGGVIRFRTDSPTLAVKAETPRETYLMPHMTALGSAGFDAYSGTHFLASFVPNIPIVNGLCVEKALYTEACERDADGCLDVTVYMPLYGAYRDISVKVAEGARILPGKPFGNRKPVVFYGSSITQGGCASTPGTSYINILSRTLNLYCLNLGFSGSCKGEPETAQYLASLDMAAFVMDYDHNAPDAAHLQKTHRAVFETVRRAHPTLPVIFASSIPVFINRRDMRERRAVIRETYEAALAAGDRNVYFLDGTDFFRDVPFDLCTVDGVHPNSLGMYQMAKGFESVLKTLSL